MDSLLIGDTPYNQTEVGKHVVKPCRRRPIVDGISFDSIWNLRPAGWRELLRRRLGR
jgi:hypothetical protein